VFTALAIAVGASAAQKPQPVREPAERTPVASVPVTQAAQDTKNDLDRLLEQYPPSLPRVLRLDPTLLSNQAYLQPYPALSAFLVQHPEIEHNPSYFFGTDQGNFHVDPQQRAIDMWRDTIQGLTIGAVMIAIASALIWLIKTLIEHRRWTRLSKIQTDVHTKLLDRFSSNEDLLAYIQTPAGRKFLESAPILLETPRSIGAPLGRILLSVQVGAVLAVGGIGLMIVAGRTVDEVREPLGALGVVAIALGIGFLLSAVMAYVISQRLGLFHPATASTPETHV
jgi:hypothetical protein